MSKIKDKAIEEKNKKKPLLKEMDEYVFEKIKKLNK